MFAVVFVGFTGDFESIQLLCFAVWCLFRSADKEFRMIVIRGRIIESTLFGRFVFFLLLYRGRSACHCEFEIWFMCDV